MKRALMAALVLVLVALAGPRPVAADTLAGVNIPDSTQVAGQTLVLNGKAMRIKYGFAKVYIGELYLPAKEKDPAKVLASDAPRRMVMHFVRAVGPDKICEGWDEGLANNSPNASAEVKKSFATLCSWMGETAVGTEVVLTYEPAKGTTIDFGGKTRGTLPGKDTADALLASWIGPKPGPGEDFKKGVLGN